MIDKKFLFGILCIVFVNALLFAESNWWEEDAFSYAEDQTEYTQIFSTRNGKKMTEAQMIAV